MTTWWRSHSVRMQLALWYVATMIAVLAVYAGAILFYVNRNASDALDQQLRGDFQFAAAMVEENPDGGIGWSADENGNPDMPWLQVWSPDGRLLFRNQQAARQPLPERALLALPDDTAVTLEAAGAPFRVLSRRGKIASRPVVFQVARSENARRQQITDAILILALGFPLAVSGAGLAGYSVSKRALAPIEQMAGRAQTITADRLGDRLPVGNPDNELGRLATVFNATLARLETSFDQMRRFTADASHELRTPLTALRSVGEVGLRGRRDDAAYRAIIGSMLEEADRLAGLVDRLLTLSRAETGQAKLSLESVDLGELAQTVAADLAVLAEEKNQRVVVEPGGSPHALGDRLMLRQALINLVDNAIKFSPSGAPIVIRVFESAGRAVVEVVDGGPGIPPGIRDHIFDRFYRAPSLSETINGTGLGLSIAKSAVEANGGTLTLEHSGADGSAFRISVPRLSAS